jgi:hypothetical protein
LEEKEEDVEKNPESKLWNIVKHTRVTEGSLYSFHKLKRRIPADS